MISRILSFSLAVLICTTVNADVTKNGNGGSIPDATGNALDSVISITPADFTAGHLIQSAQISLNNIQHSWVGDLVVTIRHSVSGRVATLFNRVGKNSLAAGVGDSSNLNGTYTFRDGGSDFWTEAANGNSDYDMAPGIYAATGADQAPVSLNNTFAGISPNGTWTIAIQDFEGGNVGALSSTTLHFVTAIPEPGAITGFALLSLFGGVYARRRYLAKQNVEKHELVG